MNRILLIVALFLLQILQGQTIIKTEMKVQEAIRQASYGGKWEIPISSTETLTLNWKSRVSSLNKKDDIQTFLGYNNDTLVATFSYTKGKIFGILSHNYETLYLDSTEEGVLVLKKEEEEHEDHQCGLCSDDSCAQNLPVSKITKAANQSSEFYIPPDVMVSDGVLRVYRLALLISYDYYQNMFYNDVEKVKLFWSSAEAFLNELYSRDIGVRFEIVTDEKLIYKTSESDPFRQKSAFFIIERTTNEINRLIGEDKYDAGMIITNSHSSRVSGMAFLGAVYETPTKGAALARNRLSTIAHEMGHMFGSNHTFSNGTQGTYFTEPGDGQSVMSYGHQYPRDFFSLVSILRIWRQLSKIGYYTDRDRTQLVPGTGDATNFPYGIKTTNTAPIINTEKLKKEYTVPEGTYIQFYIPAKDKEQKELYYAAHQTDIGFFASSNAKYLTFKPTKSNHIAFQRIYDGNGWDNYYSSQKFTGEFTFWLGAYDADLQEDEHATLHDIFVTKVKVEKGKTFKINHEIKKEFKAGEKLILKWDVDDQVFASDSKVRILMSDDLGKTYKYTLVASAPNSGFCEVTIPHVLMEEKNGVIKVEVLDHIAYAVTEYNPSVKGFSIMPSDITFQNLPQEQTLYDVPQDQIPSAPQVTATSSCTRTEPTVVLKEEVFNYLISRTWIATDDCDNQATFTQYIYIKENQPLKFLDLPEDKHIFCEQELPPVPQLKAVGGCGEEPKVSYYDVKIDGSCRKIWKRVWTATSPCSDPITFTQYVYVLDNKAPVFKETLPEDVIIPDEYQIPSQISLTAFDSCVGIDMYVYKTEERKYNEEGQLAQIIYKWEAKDTCQNTVTHTQTISIRGVTLDTQEDYKDKVTLYPNPVEAAFYVKGLKDISQIFVYDVSGKLVKQFKKTQLEYNISELSEGTYMVVVEAKNAIPQIFKIIKK